MAVADFLNVEVWTLRGLVRFHVFLFCCALLASVIATLFGCHVAGQTPSSYRHLGCQTDGSVMEQVARNLTDTEDGFLNGMKYFIISHNPLYPQAFRKTLKDSGMELIQTRIGTPQQNGYAERFVKSIQTECLDHFIFVGEKSLRKAVSSYLEHYHHERNHQGLDNLIPFPYSPTKPDKYSAIRKSERLGGLLNYYFRESQPENGKEELIAA